MWHQLRVGTLLERERCRPGLMGLRLSIFGRWVSVKALEAKSKRPYLLLVSCYQGRTTFVVESIACPGPNAGVKSIYKTKVEMFSANRTRG
jgi:hypothetical protein